MGVTSLRIICPVSHGSGDGLLAKDVDEHLAMEHRSIEQRSNPETRVPLYKMYVRFVSFTSSHAMTLVARSSSHAVTRNYYQFVRTVRLIASHKLNLNFLVDSTKRLAVN